MTETHTETGCQVPLTYDRGEHRGMEAQTDVARSTEVESVTPQFLGLHFWKKQN